MHRIRLLVALALGALLCAAPAAPLSPSGVVVSQVYAGGGNAGASFANDFVELFNGGAAAVDLTGWTVQYASASATTWQATTLGGSIPPGGYFLVGLASAGAAGAPLPAADATGTTNLAVSGGKVALVTDSSPLTCGAAPGSCSAVGSVADLVGYGSATDFEGSAPAPALSSSTAAARAGSGCTDTDSSASDFTADVPAPRNSSASGTVCGVTPPPGSGVPQSATVDVDLQPVLSLALESPSLSFGPAFAGDTPPPIAEHVTVISNDAAGYALTIHRTVFVPADLPLGVSASAPPGAQLGPPLAGGAMVGIPVAPAPDLVIGTSSSLSAVGGDVWPTGIGFTGPLPVVPPGHYSATVTYTLIGQ